MGWGHWAVLDVSDDCVEGGKHGGEEQEFWLMGS